MMNVKIEIINGETLVFVTCGDRFYFSDNCGATYISLHDETLRGV